MGARGDRRVLRADQRQRPLTRESCLIPLDSVDALLYHEGDPIQTASTVNRREWALHQGTIAAACTLPYLYGATVEALRGDFCVRSAFASNEPTLWKGWCTMLRDVLVPRGNPLTEVMELTDRDGRRWVAYIDGLPPVERPRSFLNQTILPPRRLRFDSASESRVNPELPAGAPFLTECRLLGLLGGSGVLPAVEPAPPSRRILRRQRWMARFTYGWALEARGRRAIANAAHATRLATEAFLVRASGPFACVQRASPTSWMIEAERVTRHPIERTRRARGYRSSASSVR